MSLTARARRDLLVWATVGVGVALLLGRVVASLYVDHAWYASMGALPVWREKLADQTILHGGLFVIGTLFVLLNVYAVRNSVVSLVLPRRVANLEIGEQVGSHTLTWAAVVLSLVLGGLLAAATSGWTTLALARTALPFGERDPYFDADLRFFVAWLPFESVLYVWALLAVALATAVTVFLYALTPSLRWERGGLRVSAYVRRHFAALGGVFCALLAWSYRLDAYGLAISGNGRAFDWVDHLVVVPANLVLAVAAIATGLTVVVAGWRGRVRAAFVALSLLLGMAITARQLLPFVARQVAGVDDARNQRPYDYTRVAFTRRAFGANDVGLEDSTLALDSTPSRISSASVWDAPMLVRAVTRGHAARVAGAPVPEGRSRALLLAVGPADATEAATGADWTAVRRSFAEADARGAPVALDALGTAAMEDQPVEPVRVWDAALPALPLRAGDEDAGGVAAEPVRSWVQRLAYAWSEQDFGLLRTDSARGDRAMLRRNLRERVAAVAPFFKQGDFVSPAVVGDTLFWIVPLYVASAYYPLSDAIAVGPDRWTYARHAATAIVHASTGRVSIVADSSPDAVTRSWIARFPASFVDWRSIDPRIRVQLPPAADAALGQASAYARYGSRTGPASGRRALDPDGGPALGTDGHDLLDVGAGRTAWAIPIVNGGDEVEGVVLAVGGTQPRTVYRAAARPRVRWSSLAERLTRADERDARAPRDSSAATARSIVGRVRAVPLADGSVVFVRTAYRVRADGAPLVDHVAVATADSAWTVPTLDAAPVPPSVQGAGRPVIAGQGPGALYDSSRSALRRGDWTAFGEAYDALGRALGRPPR